MIVINVSSYASFPKLNVSFLTGIVVQVTEEVSGKFVAGNYRNKEYFDAPTAVLICAI